MKKLYLLLILALPASSFAQPVIKNCDNYTAGTVLTYINCIPSGIDPGPAGADQIWDFRSLLVPASGGDTLVHYLFSNRSGSPYPTANIVDSVSYIDIGYVKSYINTAGTQTSTIATSTYKSRSVSGPSLVNTVYDRSQMLSHHPIAYNDSFNSDYTRTTPALGIMGAGSVTIKADGYGTLLLPTETDTNVLRVTQEIDEGDGDSITSMGFETTEINYFWYDDKHIAPICSISTLSTDGSSFQTNSVTYLVNEAPLEIKNVGTGKLLAFSGNLTSNGLTIRGSFEQNHLYNIAVINLAGQKLYTSEFSGSFEIQFFDIDTPLSSGIYLVSITDENNVASTGTIKVLKQ